VTIPTQVLATAGTLAISIFDASSKWFSRTTLPFTVFAPPASSSTTVSVLDLSGLGMAWDARSQLLYVSIADYDPAYPKSIVALNPATATISKTRFVGSDPAFLSVSAGGQYLYVGYDGATNETQLALPGLAGCAGLYAQSSLHLWPDQRGIGDGQLHDRIVRPEGVYIRLFDNIERRLRLAILNGAFG
jgi:DNA-binding beta-propeller fold protein YncE